MAGMKRSERRMKPAEVFPGQTGSTGLDDTAISVEMVEEAADLLMASEAQKRRFALTVEEIDAKLVALIDKSIDVLRDIISSEPPQFTEREANAAAKFQHQKTVTDAIGKLNTLVSRRLPLGNYRPCVIVQGQRWAIPIKDEDWTVYEGRLMLKTSVVFINEMETNPLKGGGVCAYSSSGECHFVEQGGYGADVVREHEVQVMPKAATEEGETPV